MEPQPADNIPIRKIILIACLATVFFGVAVWMVVPAPLTGFSWDDAWYQLIAEWLTPDSSYRMLSWAMLQVTSYPPLFPLFISWSGAGLADPQNAFVMNALFLALGSGMAMLWFVREGFTSITMAFAAILFVFNPVSLGYLPILYSEFLFTFLSTTALTFAFMQIEWKWNGKWLAIGFIVGLSVATRSAGWALVAGFLIHLVLGRRLNPVLAFAVGLGASLLIIPFLMVGLPPPNVNYMDQLINNIDNLGWGFLVRQTQGLILGWSMLWGWGAGAWLAAVTVAPGFLVRLRANRADAWFVLMYIGMLLVWPWPGHMGRFLWPLLPCFLVSAHSSFELFRKLKYRPVIAAMLMGLILAASVQDGIGRTLDRLLYPPEGKLFQLSRMHEWTRSSSREEGMKKLEERQQFLKDLQRISEIVDARACIFSEMSPLVAIHAQRVSYPSLWSSLDKIGVTNIRCEYYYMLPESLPAASVEEINRFSSMHEELFRSVMPGDPEGKLPLSVFLRFRQAPTN